MTPIPVIAETVAKLLMVIPPRQWLGYAIWCRYLKVFLISLLWLGIFSVGTMRGNQAVAVSLPTSERLYSLYLIANQAEQMWQFKSVASNFDKILRYQPDNMNLALRAMLSHIVSGQFAAANSYAEKFVRQRPNHFPNQLLGQMAFLLNSLQAVRAGRYADGLESIADLEGRNFYRWLLPITQAWLHAGLENWDDAKKSLQPLQNNQGLEAVFLLHMVMIEVMSHQFETAYKRLATFSPDGLDMPKDLFRLYCRLWLTQGSQNDLLEMMTRYRAKFPNQPEIEQDYLRLKNQGVLPDLAITEALGLAKIFTRLAQDYWQQDAYYALVFAQLALMLDPDDPTTQMLVAELYQSNGNWQEALFTLAQIDPNTPFGWAAKQKRAALLAENNQIDEAIALWQNLADERLDDSYPLYSIGVIFLREEKFQQAIAYFDQAQMRMQKPFKPNDWLFFYNRGQAFERAKQWPPAEKDFRQALQLQPEQPLVLNYLGYSLLDRGEKLDEAIQMVRLAVSKSQNNGYIIDSYGWGYYLRGEYQAAVKQLERAVSLVPYDPIINDHLGDAYWQSGRYREAQFQWKRALNLDPEPDALAHIKQKLKNGL